MTTRIVQCQNCGTENLKLENFCRNCGTELNRFFQNQQNQQMQQMQQYQQNQQMQQFPFGGVSQFPSGHFPSQLSTVATLQLIFGIIEVVGSILGGIYVLIFGILTFGVGLLLIFIPLIFFVVGVCSIISGAMGLNKNPSYGFSLFVAISQMGLLLMCDVLSFVSGLIGVIFLANEEVKAYFK